MIMEKLILELMEVAWKAARNGSQEFNCVKALSKMRFLSISSNIIAFLSNSSDVPEKLDSLSKHPRNPISNAASLVLNDWKKILYHHNRDYVKGFENSKPKFHKLQTVKRKKVPRNSDRNDGLRVEQTPPAVRKKIQEHVFEGLCMVLGEAKGERSCSLNSCDPMRVAVSVESALFHSWGFSDNGCRNKYRSFLFNLKDPKNLDFRRKILFGEIKPEELGKLSAQDMASDGRQQDNETIRARALQKCIVGTKHERLELCVF